MANTPPNTALDTEAPSRHPLPGEVIAGKYRIDRVVGAGGMGVVLAAQHLHLGQSVAIKLLSLTALASEGGADARTRFLREGRATAQLSSDHVVRVYDVGTLEDGVPYMVMELLRGEDLATLIDRRGPAPPEVAVDFIVQACDAVDDAHASGIVHRDLKPSNLFVCRRNDGRPVIKVLDFGISKAINPGIFDGNLTETRSIVGSPYYMSPEQVRDSKRVDERTDIWALGMILYELLVGDPAFNAGTLPAICAAIAADQPVPIRSHRPDIDAALDAVVMRCLEKDPDKRYQTIRELVRALAPFAGKGALKSPEYAAAPSNASAPVSPEVQDRQHLATRIEALPESPHVDSLSDPFSASSGAFARLPTEVLRAETAEPTIAPRTTGTLLSPSVRSDATPEAAPPRDRRPVFAIGLLLAVLVVVTAVVAIRSASRESVAAPASASVGAVHVDSPPASNAAPAPEVPSAPIIAPPTPIAATAVTASPVPPNPVAPRVGTAKRVRRTELSGVVKASQSPPAPPSDIRLER